MADDYGQDPTTAGPLAAGDALAGYIDPLGALSGGDTDHDWFAVRLTAGHDYLLGLLLPTGLVITLRDASGARLAPNTGRMRDSQLYLHANSTSTYYADVGGYVFSLPAIGVISASYGPYTIQFRDLGTAPVPRFQSDASTVSLGIAWFGASPASGSWSSQNLYPRLVAQIDGDGRIDAEAPGFKIGDGLADIVGFGRDGMVVSRGTGAGNFAASYLAIANFGSEASAGGWTSQDQYPRLIGDVNGDGRDDVVAFGWSGVYVDLATGSGGFDPVTASVAFFGVSPAAGDWTTQDQNPRLLGDVNRDGRDDIVGFAYDGVWVALANGGGGFSAPFFARADFGASDAAGGWSSQNATPRSLADVNGDGMADIVGFGYDGTWVSLATGGGNFAAPHLALSGFGASVVAGGWTSQDAAPRQIGDVNGDGRADIVGFGWAGTYVALGQADGTFGTAQPDVPGFATSPAAGGWTSQDLYPRVLGDVTGDGRADLVAFAYAGVTVALAYDIFEV